MPEPYRKNLKKTKAKTYPPKILQNVKNANATIVFVPSNLHPSKFAEMAVEYCGKLDKPLLVVQTRTPNDIRQNSYLVRRFLHINKPKTLNVTGTREGKASGIQGRVHQILIGAFRLD